MSAISPEQSVPLTSNGATTGESYADQKIDPSIGQAISHGNEAEVAPSHPTSYPNGSALTSEANGIASEGAPLEKSAGLGSPVSDAAEIPTTTTTTIITTTTGPASAGSGIASPTSLDGATSSPNGGVTSDLPTNGATTGAASNGSAITPAVAAVGAGGAGAAAGAAVASKDAPKTEAPKSMSPKDAKKYNKLLKSEGKNEEKEIAAAIKTAQSNEKSLRKAKKAEAQSFSRHDSAVKDQHNASKALNKAKLAHEKAAAALTKAEEELAIKKRHTTTQSDAYDGIKKKIETLRKNKLENERDRQSRMASAV